tara:strand:- start:61 stop:1020 length:960 start_codon:yes stop_codon:yes gene_type:complete
MNKIIICSVIISLIIVSTSFIILMDAYIVFYDPNWIGIINNENNNKKLESKIMLLGSSSAYAVNATSINEKLLINNYDFHFYNLADMSDTPKKRLKTFSNVLSHEPQLILYGIGVYDFENYKPKIVEDKFQNYILDPQFFFRNSFQDLLGNELNEEFPLSPKDRVLTFLKYVLRGPDYHYHPFINFSPTPINSFETIEKIHGKTRDFNKIDMSDNNLQILALKQIIRDSEINNIKIILFTNPNSKIINDTIESNELKKFENSLVNLAEENNIPLIFLHDKFSEMNIWRDPLHIAIHPDANIFTNEISNILLEELRNNAV